jgi:tetratricopeptide (TPR) repeat protein
MECPKCHFDNPVDTVFCGKCGTKFDSGDRVSFTRTLETGTDELTRGTVFAGRYEIIEELGAGGMGRVYRAQDTKLNEEVALKLIKPKIAAEKRVVERFRNELKTARKIRHRNVCGMYDLHEEGKTLYLTMEYVRGEDLKSFIHRSKALTAGTAVSIGLQVAEGLAEAHKLDITHRDLKPGNIMIDKDGQAKIMDFGIARVRQEKGITGEGAVVGTPEYMSPEQVEGKEVDPRADIYALGVILFEMLAGRPPFEGETPLAVAHKHQTEPPPIPKKLVPQIPDGLNKLILRCLEKDPAKRYQTAEELVTDLSAVEGVLPVIDRIAPQARTKTSREITVNFTPRKLIISVAALILVVVLVVVFVKILSSIKTVPSQPGISTVPAVAILYFKNNTGDKNLDIWKEGLSLSLITKLSQSRYFRVLDQSQIYGILKRLNLLEQDNLTPEDLKEIASRGLATHLIRGNLSKAGDRFRIDLILQNASTLQIIAPESADGIGEESLFAMVDSLADNLKKNLGLTAQQAAMDVSKNIKDVTTNSIEAFKFYVQGYQLSLRTPFDPSIISLMEKAVAVDPQFAMAYLILAVNSWGVNDEKFRTNIQKAFDLRERVSERERLLIEAAYLRYTSEETWDKAIAAYSKLITLYPWELYGGEELAFLYFQMEEYDKAVERFEVLWKYKYQSASAYHVWAWSYLSKGQSAKAREVLEGYLNEFADNSHIRANLGMVYCIQGDFKRAKNEIEKAYNQTQKASDPYYKLFFLLFIRDFVAIDFFIRQWEADFEASRIAIPSVGARCWSFSSQGKIKEAIASIDHEIEKWRSVLDLASLSVNESRLADLLEKIGDFSQALSACDNSLGSARKLGNRVLICAALYRRGIIQARQGKLDEAIVSANELKQLVNNYPMKKLIRFHEGLLGLIALLKKDAAGAQVYLQKALILTPIEGVNLHQTRPELLDFLAEAYELSSRWTDAQRSYEEIQSIKVPNLWPANALILAKSYYKLGRVLEHQGDKVGAATCYRKFLYLWKDADAGLPEVEDAQKRLARLKGS